MSKSITVEFADGTSHTYNNVPDSVTQEQAEAKAAKQYNKTVATPAGFTQRSKEIAGTAATNVGAGAAMLGHEVANHPVIASGLGYGAYKLAQRIPGIGPAVGNLGEKALQTFVPKYDLAKNLMGKAETWAQGQQANAEATTKAAELRNLESERLHDREMVRRGVMTPEEMQQREIGRTRTTTAVETVPKAPVPNYSIQQPAATYNVPTSTITETAPVEAASVQPAMPAEPAPVQPAMPAEPALNYGQLAQRYGQQFLRALPALTAGYEGALGVNQAAQGNMAGAAEHGVNAALAAGTYLPGMEGTAAGGLGLATYAPTLNTGEQQQLNQMYPEQAQQARINQQAIQAAGRQPTSAADLDQMIRAAAARQALVSPVLQGNQ